MQWRYIYLQAFPAEPCPLSSSSVHVLGEDAKQSHWHLSTTLQMHPIRFRSHDHQPHERSNHHQCQIGNSRNEIIWTYHLPAIAQVLRYDVKEDLRVKTHESVCGWVISIRLVELRFESSARDLRLSWSKIFTAAPPVRSAPIKSFFCQFKACYQCDKKAYHLQIFWCFERLGARCRRL